MTSSIDSSSQPRNPGQKDNKSYELASNGLSVKGAKARLEADRASLYHTTQTNNQNDEKWMAKGIQKSKTLRGEEVSLGHSSSLDNCRQIHSQYTRSIVTKLINDQSATVTVSPSQEPASANQMHIVTNPDSPNNNNEQEAHSGESFMRSLKRGPSNQSPLRNVRIVTSSGEKPADQDSMVSPGMKVTYMSKNQSPSNLSLDMRPIEQLEKIMQTSANNFAGLVKQPVARFPNKGLTLQRMGTQLEQRWQSVSPQQQEDKKIKEQNQVVKQHSALLMNNKLRSNTLNHLLSNSTGILQRKTVVVRKTQVQKPAQQKSKSRSPGARKPLSQIRDEKPESSPDLTYKSASLAANATNYGGGYNMESNSPYPIPFRKRLVNSKAFEMLKMAARRDQQTMYGTSVTPNWDRSYGVDKVNAYQPVKTPEQKHNTTKGSLPQIDIVVTSYNNEAGQPSQSSFSPTGRSRNIVRVPPMKTESTKTARRLPYSQLFQLQKLQMQDTAAEKMQQAQNLALTAMRFKQDHSIRQPIEHSPRITSKLAHTKSELALKYHEAVDYSAPVSPELEHKTSFKMLSSTLVKQPPSPTKFPDEVSSSQAQTQTQPLNNQVTLDSDMKCSDNQQEILVPARLINDQVLVQGSNTNSPLIKTRTVPHSNYDTPAPSSPSEVSRKKRVLSLYAGKQMSQIDDENRTPRNNSALEMESLKMPKVPLSQKYANLIARARREISKNDKDFAAHQNSTLSIRAMAKKSPQNRRKNNESPLDILTSSFKSHFNNTGLQSKRQKTPPDEEINKMYNVETEHLVKRRNFQLPLGQKGLLQLQDSPEKQEAEQKQHSKMKKMEMARKMLQMQNVWNHNTKNERLSSKKRKQQMGAMSSLMKDHQGVIYGKEKRGSSLRTSRNQESKQVLSQLDDIWSYNKRRNNQAGKQFRQTLHGRNQNQGIYKTQAVTQRGPSQFDSLPQLDIRMADESTERLMERDPKQNRFAKVPLLSDPIKKAEPKQDMIDHSQLFRGNKQKGQMRQSSEQTINFRTQSMASLLGGHSRSKTHAKLANVSASIRASIENIKTPITDRNFDIRHAESLQFSQQHPMSMRSSTLGLLNQSQKKINRSTFKEQQNRLRELIRKRNALQESKIINAQDTYRIASSNKSKSKCASSGNKHQSSVMSIKGVDEPCTNPNCGYCSSKSDSIFNEDQNVLSDKEDEHGATFASKINSKSQNSFNKSANRTNRSGFKPVSSGLNSGGSDTDLLRIQTQILNQRPSPKLVQMQNRSSSPLQIDAEDEDEVERYSIAVDMRAMQEMHDSLHHNSAERPGAINVMKASADLDLLNPSRDGMSPSIFKRQTHTTLYNNGSIPDYMVHSPGRIGNKKISNGSMQIAKQRNQLRETPNLDLAHIEERVSQRTKKPKGKSPPRTVFNKPAAGASGSKRAQNSQVASSSGFQMIQLGAQTSKGENSYAEKSPSMNIHTQMLHPKLVKTVYDQPMTNFGSDSAPNSPSIIDKDLLMQNTMDRLQDVKILATKVSLQEQYNRLEASQSGYFGLRSAASANSKNRSDSQRSDSRLRGDNIGERNAGKRIYLDQLVERYPLEQTPFQRLIEKASSNRKSPVPRNNNPSRLRQQYNTQRNSSFDSDEARLKAMFKSPPRSQIGKVNKHDSSGARHQKAGVGGSNLLQTKGVHIGGGGIVCQRMSSMGVSFNAKQDSKRDSVLSNSQNQPQSILPAALVPIDNHQRPFDSQPPGSPSHQGSGNTGMNVTNSLLDSNSIYRKTDKQFNTSGKNLYKNSPQHQQQPQKKNNDLQSIVNENGEDPNNTNTGTVTGTGTGTAQQSQEQLVINQTSKDITKRKKYTQRINKGSSLNVRKTNRKQTHGGVMVENNTNSQNEQVMRITGYGVNTIQAIQNQQKQAQGDYMAYYAKLRSSLNKYQDKRGGERMTQRIGGSPEIVPPVHIQNQKGFKKDKDAKVDKDESSVKKDSLYITLTGKESISEGTPSGMPSEYFQQPSVKAIRVSSLPHQSYPSLHNNNEAKRLSLVQLNSNLIETGPMMVQHPTQAGIPTAREVQCGSSLQGSSHSATTNSLLRDSDPEDATPREQQDKRIAVHDMELDTPRTPMCECTAEVTVHASTSQNRYKNNNVKVQMKQSPYGTITLGEGDTVIMLDNSKYWQSQIKLHENDLPPPDLTIHGQSMGEIHNSSAMGSALNPTPNLTAKKTSPRDTALKISSNNKTRQHNRSQDSVVNGTPSSQPNKFDDLLRIHAYKKSPKNISRLDSQTTILKEEQKDMNYQVRNSRRRPPHTRQPKTPPDADLAVDGVALIENETHSEDNKSEREKTPLEQYDTRGRKTVLAAPSKIIPSPNNNQQRINVKLITTEPLADNGMASGNTTTPDVNFQEYILEQAGEHDTHLSPSHLTPSHLTPSQLDAITQNTRLEPRGGQMQLSLHDHEELCKNFNVTQEVKEMQKGLVHYSNTTNTMEMFNSTIMKIIVTQKKVNAPGVGTNQSQDSISQYDTSPRLITSPKGMMSAKQQQHSPGPGIFGSSVLINGVAMQSAAKQRTPSNNARSRSNFSRNTQSKGQARAKQGALGIAKFGSYKLSNNTSQPNTDNAPGTPGLKALSIMNQRNQRNFSSSRTQLNSNQM